MKPLLTLTSVFKRGDEHFSITDVSLSQNKLEKIAIAGETGAGKSSLLQLIAGLLQPDAGQLTFEGERIIGPDEKLVPGHPGIAYLSQHFELQKSLRVEQVLAYSNILPARDANNLYAVCQIDHLLKRRTDQLSGGEKQRVAMCRLLISRPRLLLLDEPYAHLDFRHKQTLKTVVRDIGEKLRITCILVSHDPQDTLSWADTILVMKDGSIVQRGTPGQIYDKPVNAYVGGLFGTFNVLERQSFRVLSRLTTFKRYVQKMRAKTVFVRPENIRLVRKSPHALTGKVEAIQFFGSYRHLQVRLSQILLTVMTTKNTICVGDTVHLSISSQGMHSIE